MGTVIAGQYRPPQIQKSCLSCLSMFESAPVCLSSEWLLFYPHSPRKRGAEMPFCTHCGLEYQQPANFCNRCGRALPGAAVEESPGAAVRAAVEESPVAAVEESPVAAAMPLELPYYLSLNRIFFMTALTFGFYLFYWFYLTWQQYRDYTGKEAYPVWHALALEVPIYGSFRAHAHARTFRALMWDSGLSSKIKPGWTWVLVLIIPRLSHMGMSLAVGMFLLSMSPEPLTWGGFIAYLFICLIIWLAMALPAILLWRLQINLNRYWQSLPNVQVTSARVGIGEIIFGIVGALIWLNVGIVGAVAWLRALANIPG